MYFPQLDRNSKVWVYAADRELTDQEIANIESKTATFIRSWAAHGDTLYGAGSVFNKRFLVLVVDESQVPASGCSIDTSVQFVKSLGNDYGIDFMDRINMTIEEQGSYSRVHIADLKDHQDAYVFNPMITKLSQLDSEWKVKVADSPFI